MQDLKVLAANNAKELRLWLKEQPSIHKFEEVVSAITELLYVSVNVKLFDCVEIFETGIVKNMYQVIAEVQEIVAESWPEKEPIKNEILSKARFKSTYQKRILFDKTFDPDNDFIYTALNTTNTGLFIYGEICLNFNRFELDIVFLTKESLKYINDELIIDIDALSKDVSTNQDLPILFLKKHKDDIDKEIFTNYMACCETNYIEGIVLKGLSIQKLENVTMDRNKFNSYYDLYLNQYTNSSSQVSELDKLRMKQFVKFRKQIRDKKIEFSTT